MRRAARTLAVGEALAELAEHGRRAGDLAFTCPYCGAHCLANSEARTVRHSLPACWPYQRAEPIDVLTAAGIAARRQ